MAEQRQSGLVGRLQLDALGRFRMAVLPDTKSKSFSEILEEMSDKERNSIESYAKIIYPAYDYAFLWFVLPTSQKALS